MAAIELYSTPLFSDANLVAYYRFSSGALTTDSKGSNTLTNNNTVGSGTGAFGDANGSADFGASNTNKYFSRADALGINLRSAYTITFWVKISTAPTSSTWSFFDMRSNVGGNDGIQNPFYFKPSGLNVGFNLSPTNNAPYDLGTTNWHMLTISHDGSGNMASYIDATSFLTGTRVDGGGNSNITIGANIVPGNFLQGLVDDWAVFSRVLTPTEISDLYNGNWTSIKTVNGLAKASVKTVNGLAIASVKTWNGLA